MAVVSTPQAGKMTLIVGETVNGKAIAHNRIFSGVKATAADQDVFDVLNVIAGLQKMTVNGMSRTNLVDLANG